MRTNTQVLVVPHKRDVAHFFRPGFLSDWEYSEIEMNDIQHLQLSDGDRWEPPVARPDKTNYSVVEEENQLDTASVC